MFHVRYAPFMKNIKKSFTSFTLFLMDQVSFTLYFVLFFKFCFVQAHFFSRVTKHFLLRNKHLLSCLVQGPEFPKFVTVFFYRLFFSTYTFLFLFCMFCAICKVKITKYLNKDVIIIMYTQLFANKRVLLNGPTHIGGPVTLQQWPTAQRQSKYYFC